MKNDNFVHEKNGWVAAGDTDYIVDPVFCRELAEEIDPL